jgi:predicted amidophosphoribosyltransferase
MATCARCGEPHADLARCGPCDEPFCPGCRVELPRIDTYCADCFARLRHEYLHDYYGEDSTLGQIMAGMIADGEVKPLAAPPPHTPP